MMAATPIVFGEQTAAETDDGGYSSSLRDS